MKAWGSETRVLAPALTFPSEVTLENQVNVFGPQSPHLEQDWDHVIHSISIYKRLKKKKSEPWGTSLVVQWLRLDTPNAGGRGLIPGRGTST